MTYTTDQLKQAKASLRTQLQADFGAAHNGLIGGYGYGEGVNVYLSRQPSTNEKQKLPDAHNGIPVTYKFIGQTTAYKACP